MIKYDSSGSPVLGLTYKIAWPDCFTIPSVFPPSHLTPPFAVLRDIPLIAVPVNEVFCPE